MEIEELRRNWHTYCQDQWNFLDVLGLVMLFGGFIARLADNESLWGRALYALSAPMMFSRVLFFAQILRFQGPMIQVTIISNAAKELLFCLWSLSILDCTRSHSYTFRCGDHNIKHRYLLYRTYDSALVPGMVCSAYTFYSSGTSLRTAFMRYTEKIYQHDYKDNAVCSVSGCLLRLLTRSLEKIGRISVLNFNRFSRRVYITL